MRRLLPLGKRIEAMRRALSGLSEGRVVQPLRSVMELPRVEGMLFLKPAMTAEALAAIVLMDPRTGRTLAGGHGPRTPAAR